MLKSNAEWKSIASMDLYGLHDVFSHEGNIYMDHPGAFFTFFLYTNMGRVNDHDGQLTWLTGVS